MARKSRKETATAAVTEVKGYKTAIYVRLSREDERKIESESVENQIEFLKDFVGKDATLTLVDEYVDRAVTGTKFDRPEFNRMIADIRSGRINCVVVKDLSRLGRNYLEAGDYIEKIFPFFGVRFIAVTDNYDSLTSNPTEDGLVVPLKNLINEAYAKDISKKICTSFENQFKQGVFLACTAAYGYKKDPNDSHMVLVDEEVKDVVVRIFDEYVSGKSMAQIARELNKDGVLAPGAYWYSKGVAKRKYKNLWIGGVIGRILQNPIYTGDVRIGKTQKCYYKGITKPVKREGYYVENHHEAIIDHKTFDRVQEMIEANKKEYFALRGRYKGRENKKADLLQGLMYCGDCGNRMTMHRHNRTLASGEIGHYSRYVCNMSSHYGDADPSKSIKVEKMEIFVLELIKGHIAVYVDAKDRLKILNKKPAAVGKRAELEKKLSELDGRRGKINGFIRNLYEDFTDEILSEDEYLEMKSGYVSELDALEAETAEVKAAYESYTDSYGGDAEMAEAFSKYVGVDELTRELAVTFIKKITCFSNDRFDVEYAFSDEYQKFMDLVEKRGAGEA